jgi:hypothetical protein
MKLLNQYRLPAFNRIQWASKEIKEKYEPMLKTAKQFFHDLEKLSVEHKLRKATTAHVYPEHLMFYQQQLLKRGLVYVPIQKVGWSDGVASYHPKVEEGKPWTYYGAVSYDIKHAIEFANASEEESHVDHTVLGKLLGYPTCCTEYFLDRFNQGFIDNVWDAAMATDEKHIRVKDDNLIVLKDLPWEANFVMRSMSIGALFHLSCSFTCSDTLAFARSWYDLGKELNIPGREEVEMFLRMPIEWDCYKGIAYIKTPLFKAAINSNMSSERYVVRLEGTYYPKEAPNSNQFPWDIGTKFATTARGEKG